MVESAKGICLKFSAVVVVRDGGFAGDDDLSLNAREGLGENGDRHSLLVFVRDSHKGFVLLLVYASAEAFSPSEIFSQVSPDVQGFLWARGSRCGVMWGGMWGGRGSFVSRCAMWVAVGYSGELLAHFLEFSSNAR
jgi:hypothetical protein